LKKTNEKIFDEDGNQIGSFVSDGEKITMIVNGQYWHHQITVEPENRDKLGWVGGNYLIQPRLEGAPVFDFEKWRVISEEAMIPPEDGPIEGLPRMSKLQMWEMMGMWRNSAFESKNVYTKLHYENGDRMGVIEEAKDSFMEVLLTKSPVGFFKVWHRPDRDREDPYFGEERKVTVLIRGPDFEMPKYSFSEEE